MACMRCLRLVSAFACMEPNALPPGRRPCVAMRSAWTRRPDQAPCYNVAVNNLTTGELLWSVTTSPSAALKDVTVSHHRCVCRATSEQGCAFVCGGFEMAGLCCHPCKTQRRPGCRSQGMSPPPFLSHANSQAPPRVAPLALPPLQRVRDHVAGTQPVCHQRQHGARALELPAGRLVGPPGLGLGGAPSRGKGEMAWRRLPVCSSRMHPCTPAHSQDAATLPLPPCHPPLPAPVLHAPPPSPLRFRYWLKDIDLSAQASFAAPREEGEMVFIRSEG